MDRSLEDAHTRLALRVDEIAEDSNRRHAQLQMRLAEAKDCLAKYVKSEANAEMMTAVIRILETLIYGEPTTPMRRHHHE